MGWKTGGIRPHKPLEVIIDNRVYRGWVSQIFRDYLQVSQHEGKRLPQGWEVRIWKILQAKYPHYIIDDTPQKAPPQVNIATIRSFLGFVRKRGMAKDVVEEKEARRRADICAKCPKAGVITGCTACKGLVKSMVRVPKMNLVPSEKSGCCQCGCFVDVKVWIPNQYLEDEVRKFDWPNNCWMLTLDAVNPSGD